MDLNDVKKAKLYSMKEVADFIGVSYMTLYRLVKSGRIKAMDVGQKERPIFRFKAEDVQAYYDSLQDPPAGPKSIDK